MQDRLLVVQVNDLNTEGVAALSNGAMFAFTCAPLHDNPPGDWYIVVKVLCRDATAANKIATTFPYTERPVAELAVLGQCYFTQFMGARERKSDDTIAQEMSALTPYVTARASEVMALLEKFAKDLI